VKFVNRDEEIKFLEEHYSSKSSEFMVLYGRRRVGKTELLHKFSERKKHIYFCADMTSSEDQLRTFSNKIFEYSGEKNLLGTAFPGWEKAFIHIAELARKKRLLLIIDEFPYLVMSDNSLPSIIQKIWDSSIKGSNIFLILCGSYISFMERKVLSHKSPLFGRRTGQIYLLPLEFSSIHEFFPSYNPMQIVETYAILGGVPEYLLKFEENNSVFDNIERRILSKGEFLYDEVRFLLTEELREPKYYFAVLKAIAFGNTKLNEIFQHSGLSSRNVASKYLDVLQDLRIVEKSIPITEGKSHKSRKGMYRISDNFIRFWFRFVFPNRSNLEDGDKDFVKRQINQDFSIFVSRVFEDICIQFLKKQRSQKKDFAFEKIGGWWDKDDEIDIVALSMEEKSGLFAEVKWTNKMVGVNILDDLERKSDTVIKDKKLQKVRFAIFSKSGFTDGLKKRQKEVLLLGLKDIVPRH
jgi:AAA+ ATPase superfamily predicted ATPase